MDLYYNLSRQCRVDADNNQISAQPKIFFAEMPTWIIHFYTGDPGSGVNTVDLSYVTSWRAAIDADWTGSTDPMCRTVTGIDASRAADGIIGVPLDAATARFASALDGRQSAAAFFELRGYDLLGHVVIVIQTNVTACNSIDPTGTSDLDPVPDGMASEAWVRSFLASKADTADAVQPGTVHAFAGDASSIPAGYLLCNGAAVSRTDYAALFAAIGTIYGTGDGSTTFNLPDFRGKFLRGYLDGTSAALGTAQGDAIRNLEGTVYHMLSAYTTGYSSQGSGVLRHVGAAAGPAAVGANETKLYEATLSIDASLTVPTAAENRPANYAINWIIKY